MVKPKTAAWALFGVGLLLLVAAVVPLTRGGSVNATLLIFAGVFVVLSGVVAKKGPANGSHPPAA